MFVIVKLLKGYSQPLWYKIPHDWPYTVVPGMLVTVPLRTSLLPAVVVSVALHQPPGSVFKVKELYAYHQQATDTLYYNFVRKIGRFYRLEPSFFYQRIRAFLKEKAEVSLDVESRHMLRQAQHERLEVNHQHEQLEVNYKHEHRLEESLHDDSANHQQEQQESALTLRYRRVMRRPADTSDSTHLTLEQQTVVDYIAPKLIDPVFTPTLLHGVTGSGKTEVYAALMKKALQGGQSVIFLLPEVSLALQFERILAEKLPENTPLFGFHSAMTQKEKQRMWQHVTQNVPAIIVGVHLPVLLPLYKLGLIIVDEEHEQGFEEKKHPKINSKHIALVRAQEYKIPIILGSATPAVSSLYQVERGAWRLFLLTKRFAGQFPTIKHVFLLKGEKRPCFWLSRELFKAIQDRLDKKEQTIIYLNRRGFSFFVQCGACGFVFECSSCSVSLTLHKQEQEEGFLQCHYCGYHCQLPKACLSCKASEKTLLYKGIGTQQMVTTLQKLFPKARIARADLDTTKKKRAWHKTVEQVMTGELDIIVGTQLITKGYHFPRVTLVGVIWADLNLHFPLYNAAERTLQQLIQVAGRAGRSTEQSLVIIQSLQDHAIFEYLDEQNYVRFYTYEKSFRLQAGYPPYMRLLSIELKHRGVEIVERDAELFYNRLTDYIQHHKLDLMVLGPSRPLVYRIDKVESRYIMVKGVSFEVLHKLLDGVGSSDLESALYTEFVA